jgi:hypothetical protein
MPDTIKTNTTIASAVVVLIATFVLAVVSNYEHYRNPRPSSPIGIYLVVTWIFDVAKSRSLFAIKDGKPLGYMAAVSAALKFSLLVLEVKEKQAWLIEPKAFPAPESTANFFNRLTFFWINSLLLRGYGKPLQEGDLLEVQDQIIGEKNILSFADRWEKCKYILTLFEALLTWRSKINTRTSRMHCSNWLSDIIGEPSHRLFYPVSASVHLTSVSRFCSSVPSDTCRPTTMKTDRL